MISTKDTRHLNELNHFFWKGWVFSKMVKYPQVKTQSCTLANKRLIFSCYRMKGKVY